MQMRVCNCLVWKKTCGRKWRKVGLHNKKKLMMKKISKHKTTMTRKRKPTKKKGKKTTMHKSQATATARKSYIMKRIMTCV